MSTDADELRRRSKAFAVRVVKLCRAMPHNLETRTVESQVLRSATSVAANYRAACRARTHPDFVSKIGIVVEECDETVFWLELLVDLEIFPAPRVQPLLREANELLAIFAASQLTAKQRAKAAIVNRQSSIVNSPGDRNHG
jgi:four helix bundle protein